MKKRRRIRLGGVVLLAASGIGSTGCLNATGDGISAGLQEGAATVANVFVLALADRFGLFDSINLDAQGSTVAGGGVADSGT